MQISLSVGLFGGIIIGALIMFFVQKMKASAAVEYEKAEKKRHEQQQELFTNLAATIVNEVKSVTKSTTPSS